jgi:hypothetical protein
VNCERVLLFGFENEESEAFLYFAFELLSWLSSYPGAFLLLVVVKSVSGGSSEGLFATALTSSRFLVARLG